MERTDRELLELAAEAAHMHGWEHTFTYGGKPCLVNRETLKVWNPLEDDGDALRLAIDAFITVEFGYCADDAPIVTARDDFGEPPITECMAPDFRKKTRRVIVRAAAQVAATMRDVLQPTIHEAESNDQKDNA